jgi:hypothetical protein
LFLFQNRLTELDAFPADVDISGAFNKWSNVTVALAAERTECILLRRAAATTTPSHVFANGHIRSFYALCREHGLRLVSLTIQFKLWLGSTRPKV